MEIERGRAAVWKHAEEAGMQDDIKRVAALFDIADIAIFTPGKMTYLDQRPMKVTRVRVFHSDMRQDPTTGKLVPKQGK